MGCVDNNTCHCSEGYIGRTCNAVGKTASVVDNNNIYTNLVFVIMQCIQSALRILVKTKGFVEYSQGHTCVFVCLDSLGISVKMVRIIIHAINNNYYVYIQVFLLNHQPEILHQLTSSLSLLVLPLAALQCCVC